ncbi:unnamed protein product [Somion occarium]|uniref:Peptidase A1 domain-containing protein n=1 Tax=Somion occarium TaxID=3059160 RepID=A0ABP1DHZ1_9APHY
MCIKCNVMAVVKLSSVFLAFSFSLCSQAIRIPSQDLVRRQDVAGLNFLNETKGDVIFTDKEQDYFYTFVTVDDSSVAAAVDTTVGDLGVSGGLSNVQTTGESAPWKYAGIQSVQANVAKAHIGLAGANLTDQQYLWTSNDPQGFPYTIGDKLPHGVLGLGPSSTSAIKSNDSSALSPLDSWVASYGGNSPYVTILYSKNELDKGNDYAFAGFISYGEIIDLPKYFGVAPEQLEPFGLPDLSAISNMPVVPISSSQTIFIDDVRVGNISLAINSSISGVPSGKVAAQVQSANPYIVLPKQYVDAIYGSVSGAIYSADDQVYYLPCTTEISVTIVIREKEYLISPLNTVALSDKDGICIGKFKVSSGLSYQYDIALGNPFLENAYAVYGYQNVTDGQGQSPYWKFLSITDANDTAQQFSEYRKGNSTTTGSASTIVFPAVTSAGLSSTISFIPTSTSPPISSTIVFAPPVAPVSSSYSSSPTIEFSSIVTSSIESISTSSDSAAQTISTPATTRFMTVTVTPTPATTNLGGSSLASPSQDKTGLTLAGNLETDSDGDNESIASVLGQIKYWVPSIIVGLAVLLIISIVGIIFIVVNRRHNRTHTKPSAYRSLHESSGPVNVPLYGAEEEQGHAGYSDPYTDKP